MERSGDGLQDYLLQLHSIAGNSIRESSSFRPFELGKVLRLDADIQVWERVLTGRPETAQLSYARRELGFAVYAVSSGLYGHAFAGLRLFLELSFASVYFSANELHRRRWSSNRASFSWSAALDEASGVLSKSFVQEFNQKATVECVDYSQKASSAYRECSEFMHGKVQFTQLMPEKLAFSSKLLERWTRTALLGAESVLFLLYCRYGEEYIDGNASDLCETLEHSMSHLVSVRTILGLPVEEGN